MTPKDLFEARKKRGEALRKTRHILRISKMKLSQSTGLSRVTINNIETGQASWSIDSEVLYIAGLNLNS